MTNDEKRVEERLRVALADKLRASGEWPAVWSSAAGAPLPSGAFERWVNASGLEDWGFHAGVETEARDFMEYWQRAAPSLRQYVLHGESTAPGEIVGAGPAWWPVYEQHAAELVAPLRALYESLNARAKDLPLRSPEHRQLSAQLLEAIEAVADLTGAASSDAAWYLEGQGELHIHPLRAQIEAPLAQGLPRVEITVAYPWIDSRAVASLYERAVVGLRQEYDKPPEVEPASVRFYRAYRAQEQAGVRSKAAKLEALPPDLRGTRTANSAAAYYGKLKKAFRGAFSRKGGESE